MTRWRILYDDGSVFTDDDGLPRDAPAWGVELVWQANPAPKLCNKDYYLWREDYGVWIEVDTIGLIDHLTQAAPQITAVLVGRSIPTNRFIALLAQMGP